MAKKTEAQEEEEKKRRRDKGDGGLFKTAEGYWIGRVELRADPVTGKRRRRQVKSKSYETARKRLKELRDRAEEDFTLDTSSPTFAKWAAKWLETPKVQRLKPRTQAEYARDVNNYLIPYLGKLKVDALPPVKILDFFTWMQRDEDMGGKGVSASTTAGAYRTLRVCLEAAVDLGLVKDNVARRVEPPAAPAKKKPALDAAQAKKFLTSHASDPYVARYLVGLATGGRQGEVLGTRIEYLTFILDEDGDPVDVDIEFAWALQRLPFEHGCGGKPDKEGVWACGKKRAGYCPKRWTRIPASHESEHAYGGLWLLRPKSDASWRTAAGGPFVAQVLWRLKGDRESGFLFTNEKGHPVDPSRDHAKFQAWLKEAGLPAMGTHSTRYSAAQLLELFGADEKTRMDQMGHATTRMSRHYSDRTRALIEEPMRELNAALAFDYAPAQQESSGSPS